MVSRTTRRITAALAGLAFAVGALVGTAPAAGADQTLSAGSVVALQGPNVAVRPFADGRLFGYGLAARVLGTSFVPTYTDPVAGVLTADAGDELAVVSLSLSAFDPTVVYWLNTDPVSYTHLTLPTNREV